jgi:intracellular septation protein
MKMLFDFLPIVLFFITYKFLGIYPATLVAMITSAMQIIYIWLRHHRLELMQIITLVIILVLGSATLFLHNPMFIKWKPTAIYWVFAVVFLATHFVAKKTLLEQMLGQKITLPKAVWNKLNLSWTIFFAVLGLVNIYVIYNFSTNAWVNFKLFGALGLTVAFVIIQSFYIAKYAK